MDRLYPIKTKHHSYLVRGDSTNAITANGVGACRVSIGSEDGKHIEMKFDDFECHVTAQQADQIVHRLFESIIAVGNFNKTGRNEAVLLTDDRNKLPSKSKSRYQFFTGGIFEDKYGCFHGQDISEGKFVVSVGTLICDQIELNIGAFRIQIYKRNAELLVGHLLQAASSLI